MMREMEQGRGAAVNMNGLRVLVVIQRGGGGYCPNKWISLTNPTALTLPHVFRSDTSDRVILMVSQDWAETGINYL